MAEPDKRNTSADFDLPYWSCWTSLIDAQLHIAEIVGGLESAAELLRRRIIDVPIEIGNVPKTPLPLTIEDFRTATADRRWRASSLAATPSAKSRAGVR